METESKNSLRDNLPPRSYKRIGEIAGKLLGRDKPVGYFTLRACIQQYPEKPHNVAEETNNACIKAILQVIKEGRDKSDAAATEREKLTDEVNATLATVPVS